MPTGDMTAASDLHEERVFGSKGDPMVMIT